MKAGIIIHVKTLSRPKKRAERASMVIILLFNEKKALFQNSNPVSAEKLQVEILKKLTTDDILVDLGGSMSKKLVFDKGINCRDFIFE